MLAPVFVEGNDVALKVPVPNVDGVTVMPTGVTVSVTDSTGAYILPDYQLDQSDISADEVIVRVPASSNVVNSTELFELRRVNLTFAVSARSYQKTAFFLLRSDTPLIKMVNSFQSTEEAVVSRAGMLEQTDYDTAEENDRINAMAMAYEKLAKLRYRVSIDTKKRITTLPADGEHFVINRLFDFDAAEFDALPEDFKIAIRKGQIAEANAILRGDDAATEKLNAGIVLEKIGESTTEFKSTAPLRSPASPDAMKYLKGYMYRAVHIGRG